MCTGNTLSWFLVWWSSLQHCYFSLVGKCDEDVCLCVFPWACFHNYMSRFHQIFVLVTCGRGSVLWWRFDTFLWTMSCLHIMARNRWCIKVYTQTDSPWGSTGPGAKSDIGDCRVDRCAVQLSKPQVVNIPERYAAPPGEDEERNLSAEERQRRREMSERYRRMVAAQRCVSLCHHLRKRVQQLRKR